MPLPLTVAVPTVEPPLVQVVGAVVWGPKTEIVIVPVGLDPAGQNTRDRALRDGRTDRAG